MIMIIGYDEICEFTLPLIRLESGLGVPAFVYLVAC